jgi:hypothetical protein
MGRFPRDVDLQALENKVLSQGIIGKSAPILAEITIRKSQVSLLLPLMLGARLAKRRKVADDMAEFRIGHLLNGCLENLLSLERWLIRAGISFPVGGSLLMMARKLQR